MEAIHLVLNPNFCEKYYRVCADKFNVPDRSAILVYSNEYGMMEKPDLNKVFSNIAKNSKYNYVLIIGKGDYDLEIDEIPANLKRVYCNNYVYETNGSKVRFFPMGRDYRSVKSFYLTDPNSDKDILCYCNFSLTTHKSRPTIYNMLKDKPFIQFEHMGKFLKYSISRDEFFKKLNRSKFVICPRGAGRDSYRFYDSIYCGAIPIVVREKFHSYFDDLPILFLDKVSDYKRLTTEFLEEQYTKLIKKKKDYYKELDFKWWLERVHTDLSE